MHSAAPWLIESAGTPARVGMHCLVYMLLWNFVIDNDFILIELRPAKLLLLPLKIEFPIVKSYSKTAKVTLI